MHRSQQNASSAVVIRSKELLYEANPKAGKTRVRIPAPPPIAYWLARVNSRIVPDTQYATDGGDTGNRLTDE